MVSNYRLIMVAVCLRESSVLLGPEVQRDKLGAKLQIMALKPRQQVKNLGAILDSELSFEPRKI